MSTLSLFATCLPGLEPVLLEELIEKGIGESHHLVSGGVEFTGSLAVMARANRELGVAQQIRVRLAEFHATKLAELARKSLAIPFGEWLSAEQPLRVRVTSRKSRLYHTGAIAERVERAIVEQLGRKPEEADGQQVLIRVEANLVQVSFDTSGEPLHRRGYRLASGKAPLREDLACALVRVSGWDRTSPFVDPMMGAGTIAIEAAQLALGLAPGRLRSFAFESSPIASTLEPCTVTQAPTCPPIHASDRDQGALEAATGNAERAGVLDALTLGLAPISGAGGIELPAATLVTNPPYGKRVASKDLRPLFGRLGKMLKDRPAWNFACVSPDRSLSRQLGINLESVLMTDHGGIKVRFYRRPAQPE